MDGLFAEAHNINADANRTNLSVVAQWPLMSSPLPTYLLTLGYLIFSWWLGPLVMQSRKAYTLRESMFVYNVALFWLNVYIMYEFVSGGLSAGYTYPCMPFTAAEGPGHIKVANGVWWYFVSKLIEFMDTIFFVLRKKDRQISFLHVYHHASMPLIWWFCAKWVPGGQSVYGAGVNTVVHIIMYFYYAVSSLGPEYQKYLWWKKYLTQLQLIQFVYVMWLCAYSWYTACPYTDWIFGITFLQVMSFLILFLNFYARSYLDAKKEKSKAT